MSISQDHAEVPGPLEPPLLGSPLMPPRRHRLDENQGGLAYLLLSSQAPAQQGLKYLRLGSHPATEAAEGSSPVTTAIPCLPPGATPPAAEGSVPVATSGMRSGDLEEGGTAGLASDRACDDKKPWSYALVVRFESLALV